MIKLIAILMLTILWSLPAFATSCRITKSDEIPAGDLIVKAKIVKVNESLFGDKKFILKISEMYRGPADMQEYFTGYRIYEDLLNDINLSEGRERTFVFILEDNVWRLYSPVCVFHSEKAWAEVYKTKLPFKVGEGYKGSWYDFLIYP